MIDLLVFDVDGCLTNGGITYSVMGDETKTFNVKDGLAIASWMRMGNKSAIITGRNSKVVERRAQELGITYLFQGIKNKQEVLESIMEKENLSYENIAAIGDDLNDFQMLQNVSWGFTPNDGSKFIKEIADTVLESKGGEGAVREMIELILERDGRTEEFLKLWQ